MIFFVFVFLIDYTKYGKQKKFYTEKVLGYIFPRFSNFETGQFDPQHNRRVK